MVQRLPKTPAGGKIGISWRTSHDFLVIGIILNLDSGQINGPHSLQMNVLYLTIFVSVMLALFFVAGFIYHHDFSGGDPLRDSLLPFQKENPPKPDGEQDHP
jgi:hypothetical protein